MESDLIYDFGNDRKNSYYQSHRTFFLAIDSFSISHNPLVQSNMVMTLQTVYLYIVMMEMNMYWLPSTQDHPLFWSEIDGLHLKKCKDSAIPLVTDFTAATLTDVPFFD